MPPKRDSSANQNGNSTANSSNNETAATSSTTITVATNLQSNSTTSSTNSSNNSTNNTATAAAAVASAANAANSILPVYIADAAAEQRTIAYQANAKLCRLVRKCPWMYDRNHHNYAKKHILDKSWCKIAKECNDSVASCKERWRNIRAAFARSINIYKTHSGPNRVKPYYLHKELSFLVKPMMEGRDKKEDYDDGQDGGGGGGVKDEENGEDDVAEEDEEEDEEPAEEEEDFPDDIKSAFEALNPDIRIQTETRYQKLLRSNNNNNNNNEFESSGIFEPHTEFTTASDAENEFHFPEETLTQAEAERRVAHMLQQQHHQQQQQQQPHNGVKRPPMHLETEEYDTKRFKLSPSCTTANENDIRFLEALLPDMALMNTRQKIVFKRKIYQTLEEVFENSNDFPNIEHNNNHKMEHNLNNSNLSTTSSQHQGHSYNTSPLPTPTQVRQTVLTVNSSTARNLINNIANLSESELQKVNGFLQSSLRNPARPLNGNNTPSSAAAKLMSSTPKITITKVTCPPPASLRNMALNKPPSPSPATVSTTIHNPSAAVISSNVHSTTSSNPNKASTTQNGTNASSSSQQNNSPWSQLLPITIKDEIEDVDIV